MSDQSDSDIQDPSLGSSSSALLPLEQQYPTALYIICPILITYFGVYVMLRNHYVFKPRIEQFLKKTHLKSVIVREVIIDVLSSLSIVTLALSSMVLSSTDQAIELMVQNDLYWVGLCMSVLAYRNLKEDQQLEMKVVIKNGIFLVFMYIIIVYQYFSNYSLLMMGLLLMAVYILNMIFKIYEQKFVNLIQVLFNTKPLQIQAVTYNHTNNMESPEYLSSSFPVSREELQERLRTYEPSLKRLKLKTKIAVTKKLLMLSLAVRISQQKMLIKMKRQVGAYYGGVNGTTNQKVKRLQLQVKNTMLDENIPRQGTRQINDQQAIANIYQVDDQLQVVFTIFPIKIFQSSTIISTTFTVLLNLMFGFCLDYTQSISLTMKYGAFLNNLYGFMLLPVLPNISKTEYFNSMALSGIWKYCLVGGFLAVSVGVNGSEGMQVSNVLHIHAILLIVMVVFVMGYLLAQTKSEFKLFIVFFLIFFANLGVTYNGIVTK